MANQLFAMYPGKWEVYHFSDNVAAGRFWSKAIAQVGIAHLGVEEIVSDEMLCRLHRFTVEASIHPA
jgi:predicted acetyltransferase